MEWQGFPGGILLLWLSPGSVQSRHKLCHFWECSGSAPGVIRAAGLGWQRLSSTSGAGPGPCSQPSRAPAQPGVRARPARGSEGSSLLGFIAKVPEGRGQWDPGCPRSTGAVSAPHLCSPEPHLAPSERTPVPKAPIPAGLPPWRLRSNRRPEHESWQPPLNEVAIVTGARSSRGAH